MTMPNHDLYRRAVVLLMNARKAQGLSIADVAAKLGFAVDFVDAYETGCWRLDPCARSWNRGYKITIPADGWSGWRGADDR